MIDSILIAETGLQGYEQALQTISNNTANMNTPGFKGSTTQFADLASPDKPAAGDGNFGHAGLGLQTLGTSLDFAPGQFQSTGNALDLAIDGQGFFTLRDDKGELRYTKDGQFKFDADNHLVSTTTGDTVMALDAAGALAPVSIADQQTNPAKATTTLTMAGLVSTSSSGNPAVTPPVTVSGLTVIDPNGASHTLSATLTMTNRTPATWSVALADGSKPVGTAQTLTFAPGGITVASGSKLTYDYGYTSTAGGPTMKVTLDFSTGVTSQDTTAGSVPVHMSTQDGYATGTLTGESFDETGTLVLTYSNGQTAKPAQLALAQFDSPDQVEALGNNQFRAKGDAAWRLGLSGTGPFGGVKSNEIEGSNVDLSREFSNLVIMQRGYQACSQVVTTAGDMLTALFGMMPK